tara:strand:+ start:6885 stop:9830 length:2946 start_codon:yes stop_codon:yes gene_type:complete
VGIKVSNKIKNPSKSVSLYNATSFGSNAPTNTPFFEYDVAGPIDFMRYRMNRIWNLKPEETDVAVYIATPQAIEISEFGSNQSLGYTIQSVSQTGLSFRKKENVVIRYNPVDIGECGNLPEPGIDGAQDKWLKVLEDGQGLTTHARNIAGGNIGPHGIISTFADGKLRDGNTPIKFDDQVFRYGIPLDSKKVRDNSYGSLSVAEASVVPNYNFYIQTYESILTQEDPTKEPHESMLPSLYSFLSVMENENDKRRRGMRSTEYDPATINTVFEKHITLERQLKETRIATLVTYNAGARAQTVEADVSKGDYFDKYAYAFSDGVKGTPDPAWRAGQNPLAERFKHQIVPSSNNQMFAEFSDVRQRFPMSCDIEFSTADTPNNEVISLFEETEMTAMFIKGFVDNTWGASSSMGYNLISSGGLPFIPDPTTYTETAFKPYENGSEQRVPSSSLDCWDLLAPNGWLTQITRPSDERGRTRQIVGSQNAQAAFGPDYYGQVEKGVFLGAYDQEVEDAQNNVATAMLRNLMSTAFKAKMQDLIYDKTRTWKQIVGGIGVYESLNMGGRERQIAGGSTNVEQATRRTISSPSAPETAYHETIFYIVEKWSVRADGTPDEKVQSFYFPNSSTFTDYKFSDTQVKYGKKYIYRIYAMEMVFGTRYWYQLDQAPIANSLHWQQEISPSQAKICVLTEPSLKMVKVPYYQKEVVMMDDPPVFPGVEVITYQNVRNQILFWMTGNSGEYDLNPIAIQPGDSEAIESLRMSQEVGPLEPIRFKSDDHARFFEVFRIDKKPSSYSDFIGNKIAHVDTKVDLDNGCQFSTSGEWIDKTISPNTTYYYIFRTIDNHGHFSNPSPVYELQMVYDGYAPYLLRNVYSLDENQPPPQKVAKKFTKYIHIKPALTQRVVDEEASGLINPDGTKIVDDTGCLTRVLGVDGSKIELGTADQTLWNKLIKVRVRSRKTGKKIDLNIKFTKKHTKIEKTGNNNLC